MMKLRDALILTAIVGGLVLMFFHSRRHSGERVKPGSPEYAAYIDGSVAECLQKQWVPAAGGETEREAACRSFVRQADRFNPGARPLKPR